MNKKILLIGIFIILLCNFVTADVGSFTECCDFSNDNCYRGVYNFTSVGASIITGIQGNAYNSTRNTPDLFTWDLTDSDLGENHTISCWFNLYDTDRGMLLYTGDAAAPKEDGFRIFAGNNVRFEASYPGINSNDVAIMTGGLPTDQWFMLSGRRNTSSNKLDFFYNGVLNVSSVNNAPSRSVEGDNFYTRELADQDNNLHGAIDLCVVYEDTAISDAEILELFNSGSPKSCAELDSFIPTVFEFSEPRFINFTETQDDWIYYMQESTGEITYNINSSKNFTCSTHFAFTTDPANWNEVGASVENFENGTNINYSYILDYTGFDEFAVYFKVNCSNIDGDVVESDVLTLLKDLINPTITTNFIDNQTYGYNETITSQFNFSDTIILHRFNVSINGVEYNSSMLNTTLTYPIMPGTYYQNYSYNFSYLTGYSDGTYNIKVQVWDGHTALELKDADAYESSNGLFNNYLRYDFKEPYNDAYVKINNIEKSLFDTFTTEYNGKDRYLINYEPNKKETSYEFEVESDNYVTIIGNGEKYGGVWVIVDEHWLDFYLPDEPNQEVKITRINDNKVLVNVSGLTEDKELLQFNSVGDLNLVEENYTFYVEDFPHLNLSVYDHNNNLITNFTAVAESFNSTHTTTNTTTTGSTIMLLLWNETYNISVNIPEYALYYNYDTIKADNYTLFMNITLYPTNTLNITFKYEVNSSIVDNHNITANLISDSFSDDYFTSNGTLWIQNLISDDYMITYQAEDFGGFRSYYFSLVNRTYNELMLYVSDNYNNITATVYDEFGNGVEGALIEVLKFDSVSNSYILTEQTVTNYQGEAMLLHLMKNNVFYKFRIRVDGILQPILPSLTTITNPTYIYSDSLSFQIKTLGIVAEDFFTIAGINGNLTFNYDTNNFRFDFSDASGLSTQACVYVVRSTNMITSDYNSSCLTASSGTILLGVEEINGTTYKAKAYIYPSGIKTFFDNYIVVFQSFYDTGKYGLFLIMLLTVVFAGISVVSPTAALIFTPIPLTLSAFLGLISPKFIPIMISVQIGGIILAVFLSKK